MSYELFTDGSALGNPGEGGWAFILVHGDTVLLKSGYAKDSTNNQMEMTAALKGLEAVPVETKVKIVTDSQYVIKGARREWKLTKNLELWASIHQEVEQRTCTWEWVKGHSGHPMNMLCDKLAYDAAHSKRGKEKKLSLVEFFLALERGKLL